MESRGESIKKIPLVGRELGLVSIGVAFGYLDAKISAQFLYSYITESLSFFFADVYL